MLNTFADAISPKASLNSASQAAGANNGAWVDISDAEGEVIVLAVVGAVTGSVVVKVQDADNVAGANAADLAGVASGAYNTANSVVKLTFPASAARTAVRVVATVTTGPIHMGAAIGYVPKYI